MTLAEPIAATPLRSLKRLFLWLNSGCNSRCRMCDIWREEKGSYLTVAEIEGWLPEWRQLSLSSVVICGEPLLHPDLWEIVAVLREGGIEIEMLSNGYLVPRHARRIVDNCEVLRISLDGPDGVHDLVRGTRRAFALVERALRSVHELDPSFPVDARCAVHRQNFRHLRETVTAAREAGFRSISFSGTDVSSEEAFKRHGRLDSAYVTSLVIAGEELDELEAELTAMARDCAADFASGFVTDTPADLERLILHHYRALAGQRPFPAVRCDAPWTSAVLEHDGTMRSCFPLPAYGTADADSGFTETLNSPGAQAFRQQLDVGSNPICERCVCQTCST